MQLRGVNFNWKDPKMNPDTQMGFIAQEVQKVVPEVVGVGNSDTGYLVLQEGPMVGLVVEAIKEQQAEITSLQSLVADIFKEINTGLIKTKKLIVDGVDILKRINELSDKADKQQTTIEAQAKLIEEQKKVGDAQKKEIEDMKKALQELKKTP